MLLHSKHLFYRRRALGLSLQKSFPKLLRLSVGPGPSQIFECQAGSTLKKPFLFSIFWGATFDSDGSGRMSEQIVLLPKAMLVGSDGSAEAELNRRERIEKLVIAAPAQFDNLVKMYGVEEAIRVMFTVISDSQPNADK